MGIVKSPVGTCLLSGLVTDLLTSCFEILLIKIQDLDTLMKYSSMPATSSTLNFKMVIMMFKRLKKK